MKKLIILFIAGILSAFSMDAQVIFRLSAGGVPGLMASTSQDFVLDRPQTLNGIYGNLYVLASCSPSYQLEVSKTLRERILVGVSLSIANGTGFKRGVNNVNNLYKKRVHNYSLMASAKYYYYNGGDFYLYGGAALGLGYSHAEIIFQRTYQTANRMLAEYELTPIGMNYGPGRIGFFVEGVVGSVVNGVRIGVKYRY